MVRVTATGNRSIERVTANDVPLDDPTPGVYPLVWETGRLQPAADGRWRAERTSVRAWEDEEAAAVSAAVYDAARGFAQLGVPPDAGAGRGLRPNELRIELGDDTWTFAAARAPGAAWAVLDAGRRITAAVR